MTRTVLQQPPETTDLRTITIWRTRLLTAAVRLVIDNPDPPPSEVDEGRPQQLLEGRTAARGAVTVIDHVFDFTASSPR